MVGAGHLLRPHGPIGPEPADHPVEHGEDGPPRQGHVHLPEDALLHPAPQDRPEVFLVPVAEGDGF